MLLSFFKKSLPQVIVVVIVLAILLWLKTFLYDQVVVPYFFDSVNMPFYAFAIKWLPEGSMSSRIVAFTAMLITALYLLHLNSKHIIIKQRTYLPALFFVLLSSCFLPLQRINPAVFSSFLILLTIDHILTIYHKENVLDNIFKAGFYVSIASLFYAPSIIYIVAVLLAILTLRAFNLRELFASLFGFFTPWFFFFFYHYFINSDLTITFRVLDFNLFTGINHNSNSPLFYIFYGYCLILFLITGVFLLNSLSTQKISIRKYYGVFFWFNLISAAIIILIPSCSIEIVYIVSVPIVFQFTHYFTMAKRVFWAELFFGFALFVAFLMQFY